MEVRFGYFVNPESTHPEVRGNTRKNYYAQENISEWVSCKLGWNKTRAENA
jgi:hypothetical protein